MQATNDHERIDTNELAQVGPAYVKFWHQGVRRLFDVCCLMYELTPDEMLAELIPLLIKKGISIDDIETMEAVLLRQRELELGQGVRMAKRYEGQTPLIDAMQELLGRSKDV